MRESRRACYISLYVVRLPLSASQPFFILVPGQAVKFTDVGYNENHLASVATWVIQPQEATQEQADSGNEPVAAPYSVHIANRIMHGQYCAESQPAAFTFFGCHTRKRQHLFRYARPGEDKNSIVSRLSYYQAGEHSCAGH